MAKKKVNTQAAIVIAVLVVLFLMFFRGGGLTAKFYEGAEIGPNDEVLLPGEDVPPSIAGMDDNAGLSGGSGSTGPVLDPGNQPPAILVQADLVPAGVTVNTRVNDTTTVYDYVLSVQNIGVANAGAFWIDAKTAGGLIGRCAIGSVLVGATQSCKIIDVGTKFAPVQEVVDSQNTIFESNENNNAAWY